MVNEVIISLCDGCKCCLANTKHCYVCHTTFSITELCGCGDCPSKAEAFHELEKIRRKTRLAQIANMRGKLHNGRT